MKGGSSDGRGLKKKKKKKSLDGGAMAAQGAASPTVVGTGSEGDGPVLLDTRTDAQKRHDGVKKARVRGFD